LWGMPLLLLPGILPLNPDGNQGQSLDLAFNTCISFLVNCNLQHYSGESGLTYFTQLFVIMLFQFITAATGMAAMAGIMKALQAKTSQTIGNFWFFFVRSCTRILFPLSLIVGFILIVQGTPMGFEGKMKLTTLEGETQYIAQGPAAAIVSIKQLGSNGGGYFGANSAHPLENPTYFTNIVECCSILLIPMAFVFAFGFYLKRRKLALSIFGVMLFAFLTGSGIHYMEEVKGNPRIDKMGIVQPNGAMEGKEVRFGAAATALWGASTTATSNGSVNGMNDSAMPLSGMIEMLNMQINTWFGGVGVGLMNYFSFIIITVFISGLMVGRTPELLGKKIEAREMKIATIVALLHPFLILTGTALASYLYVHHPCFVSAEGGWLNNSGFHGLSEMFYEFTSASANNGSGFEGLHDSTLFWNLSTAFVLIISRFVPIMGQVAMAGLLAEKKFIPEGAGTLKTDTFTFGVVTFAVIFVIAALSFFPVHALSTIAEYLSL
ncbi:MAG: potassium-transporting ATPase subunit KdpA, partial [Bacteroidales bacterium]